MIMVIFQDFNADVSKNRGTPKSSILIGFSLINHPFWGTIIFGNTHVKSHCRIVEDRNLIGILERNFEAPSARSPTFRRSNFYFLPLHKVWFRPCGQHCDWPESSRFYSRKRRFHRRGIQFTPEEVHYFFFNW